MTRLAATVSVLTMVALSNATAQQTREHTASAKAGEEVRVGWFGQLKQDCSVGTIPEPKVIRGAQGGVVRMTKGKVRTNQVSKCVGAEVPALIVFYKPNPDYIGTDAFTLEMKTEGAAPAIHQFSIKVGS